MTALFQMTSLASLLKDPPPAYAFELSEAGIAFARVAEPRQVNFAPLEAGALLVSPAHDNIHQPQVVQERIHALAPPNGHRKRRVALIVPDYCARVAVLDFDEFPADQQDQIALLRFRMKKSVPFDVDSAIVSYAVQTRTGGGKVEVLAALMGS
jgi:type IV pilus assembly protein PilM